MNTAPTPCPDCGNELCDCPDALRHPMPPMGYRPAPLVDAPVPPSPSALDTQVAGDHYCTMKIQPVEFITRNGLGFLEGCVIKRVCRYRRKAGAQDLRKAIHELQLLLELNYPGDAS